MTTRINTEFGQQRWLDCYNPSNATIPPFGCVLLGGAGFPSQAGTSRLMFSATLPSGGQFLYTRFNEPGTADDYDRIYSIRGDKFGFNSGMSIPPRSVGKCTMDLPTLALIHSSDFSGMVRYESDYEERICAPVAGQHWLDNPNFNSRFDFFTPGYPSADWIGVFQGIEKVPEHVIPKSSADADIWIINRLSVTENQ